MANIFDSLEAAIHCHPNLTGDEKYNYLRAQLKGDAANIVGGFPLTNMLTVNSLLHYQRLDLENNNALTSLAFSVGP